jgi:anthranilate synthase component 2
MKILLIDNYDSFTFNLYQYIGELLHGKEKKFILDVFRNDRITITEIKKKRYDRVFISPGPGDPGNSKYFGVCKEVIMEIGKITPVLGVCLGMQGMAYAFGGEIIRAQRPMHGKVSTIAHNRKGVFLNLPEELDVMRYHSLIVSSKNLPACFEVSALAKESNEIMGIQHKTLPIEGIQFHPESFATQAGKQMLGNFLFQNYGK